MPSVKTTPAAVPPALAPWERLDLELRQAAQRISRDFLAFSDLALRAIRERTHEHFGFSDASLYLTERIGVSYRTVRRWLSVAEAIEALPAEQHQSAREALAQLGAHKAAALAPVFGRDGLDWRQYAEFALGATVEAVQGRVSADLGLKPRGPLSAPGERFLGWLLNQMPPEVQDYVREVFEALMDVGEHRNPVAAMITMIDLAARDLAAQGRAVRPPRLPGES